MGWQKSVWPIAAAALVPLLLFAIFQIGFAAREQRRAVEARALNLSQQLIIRTDGETNRIATILDALATSQALEDGNWRALGKRYGEFAGLHRDLRGFRVRDLYSERTLLQAGVAPAQSILTADGRAATRPLFVGFARSSACRCLMFERSAMTGDGRRVIIDLLTDSDVFYKLLPPAGEQNAAAAINGPRARFIARNVDQDRRFAAMSSSYLQKAVASGLSEGIYKGFTLEQVENYTAFARSSLTGWTAHVALGSSEIDEPTTRFLASLAMAAILSLLLAGLLILFAVRQMRQARAVADKMQQSQKLEALGQLTGGLAHDFNNLLTPVIGALDLLSKRDSLDERSRRLAAGALASAQRSAKLTSQLLAFSRRQKLSIGPVPVQRLVTDVGDLIERSLGGRNRFEFSVDSAVHCVASDSNQLEVALLNLALNARDASPEGSVISLKVRQDGADHVLFEMQDHGSGMDEKTRSRALEPFFTTKPTGQGTGLGLAQVFGVVTQSGGTMAIKSVVGEGTTVILRLPQCEAKEAAQVATDEPSSAVQLLRLLVVDDDASVRAAITGLLIEDGHSVEAVASGISALALLRESEVDLVVADFLMPEMTGAELIKTARELGLDTRFLLVSGYSDSEAIAAASDNAALLQKPFTAEELRQAVAKAAKL